MNVLLNPSENIYAFFQLPNLTFQCNLICRVISLGRE
jgi:hypothetical protein